LAAATGGRALGGLGARLRAVREAAGLSGAELAKALGPGWRQPKVSRVENGQQLPSVEEIEAWARATGADPTPLLALREKASAEYGTWRERIAGAGGPAALQDEIAALERSCTTLLAEYQPGFIPGLLQTPAYMREMAEGEEFLAADGITPDELGRLIAAKVRRASILYEGGRRIVHVIGEAALRTRVGKITPETMRDQLAHLAAAALIPGHTLGVIPLAAPSPIAPASGFVIYDSDLVVIETLGGRLQITEPELIARYHRWLELLLNAAVTGPEAAELCRRVADELQDDTTSDKPVTRPDGSRRQGGQRPATGNTVGG
jgi:transcriptional regulator with XRE-family HTH domain